MAYNGLNTLKIYDEETKQYKNVRTFVLADKEAAVIHIPVIKLGAVDYRRLKEIEQQGGEMLTTMRDFRLSNGMNALVQYDKLIEVYEKPEWKNRVEEEVSFEEAQKEVATTGAKRAPKKVDEGSSDSKAQFATPVKDEVTEEKPKPKRRGRPPKKKES